MDDCQTTRLEGMKRFGFGPEVMKQQRVCRLCGFTCRADESHCRGCGAVLPRETLFDLYKARHLYCPACSTVVANTTRFCPECGKRLQARQIPRANR